MLMFVGCTAAPLKSSTKTRTVAVVESVPAEPGREVSSVVSWQGEKNGVNNDSERPPRSNDP